MEEGNGGDRNQYLKENKIKTYLVVVPDEFNDVCTNMLFNLEFYGRFVLCFNDCLNIINSNHIFIYRCKDKKVQVAWEGMFRCKCERKEEKQIVSRQSKFIFR